jgi:hypothetical protein
MTGRSLTAMNPYLAAAVVWFAPVPAHGLALYGLSGMTCGQITADFSKTGIAAAYEKVMITGYVSGFVTAMNVVGAAHFQNDDVANGRAINEVVRSLSEYCAGHAGVSGLTALTAVLKKANDLQ